MTPIMCAEAVVSALKKYFEHYRPTDEKISDHGINIFTGFLPKAATRAEKLKMDPAIVVRPISVNDADTRSSTVKLQLLVMTYCESMTDGHLELYRILEGCRRYLLTNQLIDSRYQLVLPMNTTIPEEQPFPEWWGYMEFTYTIGQPQYPTFSYGDDVNNG